MTKLIAILLALTCATLHAQTVIVKGTGADAVHRSGAGAGSVRGVATATETTYSSNRFSIFGDNTNVVVDNGSGLTWTRNANMDGTKNWTNAVAYCSNLVHASYSDWILPGVTNDAGSGEWDTLIDLGQSSPPLPLGHPFTNVVTADFYWSSTPSSGGAWAPNMSTGVKWDRNITFTYYVWPCRGP